MTDQAFINRVREHILVYSLPFWYGAITRLPFIYFVIHMRFQFELDWTQIGFFVGSYQACRVVTGIATVFLPAKVAHFLGTAMALSGNLLVLFSDKASKVPFLVGTIVIGFAETLACMQTYAKSYYALDMELLGHKLKVQYAAVCIGVTFAFAVGGVVYEFAGINGIAIFGSIASFMELVSVIAYIAIGEPESPPTKGSDLPQISSPSNAASASAQAPPSAQNDAGPPTLPTSDLSRGAVHNDMVAYSTDDDLSDYSPSQCGDPEANVSSGMTEEELEEMVDYFSKSEANPNYITNILCFTFGMEAITIGYNLAISPIFITEQFGKSTAVIGIMLAAGAGFGTLVSISMTLSKNGKKFMNWLLPDPNGFLFGMCGISLAVLLAAIPIFEVHLLGLLLLMGFNDYAAIVLNEMQGTVTSEKAYRTMAPLGQVVRRCGNVITAISGPILFGILPTLPYIVAGAVTAAWALVLIIVLKQRMKANTKLILDIKHSEGLHGSSEEQIKGMTFAKQEVMARLMKRRYDGKDEFFPKKNKLDALGDTERTEFLTSELFIWEGSEISV